MPCRARGAERASLRRQGWRPSSGDRLLVRAGRRLHEGGLRHDAHVLFAFFGLGIATEFGRPPPLAAVDARCPDSAPCCTWRRSRTGRSCLGLAALAEVAHRQCLLRVTKLPRRHMVPGGAIELGGTLVMHSATKLLSGRRVLRGSWSEPRRIAAILPILVDVGGAAGALARSWSCAGAGAGDPMERHTGTALELGWLAGQEGVDRVHYRGCRTPEPPCGRPPDGTSSAG